MEHKNYLYSSGAFAKLTGVNKRTLHYYNDIGLFCPEAAFVCRGLFGAKGRAPAARNDLPPRRH